MATVQVTTHGRDEEPVVVVDDCVTDPDKLIAQAARFAYQPIGRFFPGIRAKVPEDIVKQMHAAVADLINQVFQIDHFNHIECYFSLITTAPAQLHPIQRLPHFDGLGRQRIAIVHHLSRPEKGGTAFYRHRSTGFESITQERLPAYNLAVNSEIHRHGTPPAQYASKQTPFYEQIAFYPARFNRMLIYRGSALHSAEVPADATLSPSPITGRFSVNSFLWSDL